MVEVGGVGAPQPDFNSGKVGQDAPSVRLAIAEPKSEGTAPGSAPATSSDTKVGQQLLSKLKSAVTPSAQTKYNLHQAKKSIGRAWTNNPRMRTIAKTALSGGAAAIGKFGGEAALSGAGVFASVFGIVKGGYNLVKGGIAIRAANRDRAAIKDLQSTLQGPNGKQVTAEKLEKLVNDPSLQKYVGLKREVQNLQMKLTELKKSGGSKEEIQQTKKELKSAKLELHTLNKSSNAKKMLRTIMLHNQVGLEPPPGAARDAFREMMDIPKNEDRSTIDTDHQIEKLMTANKHQRTQAIRRMAFAVVVIAVSAALLGVVIVSGPLAPAAIGLAAAGLGITAVKWGGKKAIDGFFAYKMNQMMKGEAPRQFEPLPSLQDLKKATQQSNPVEDRRVLAGLIAKQAAVKVNAQ